MRGDAGFPVRLRFAKRGRVRFISHRDVARAFERALRVEQVPLAFSGGFSPRPKVSFGLALPVGYESDAEYLDVELAEAIDTDALVEPLTAALPEGMHVTGAIALQDRAPALQEAITSVSYEIEVGRPGSTPRPGDLARAVDDVLAASELVVTRRRKGVDIDEDVRPALRLLQAAEATVLHLEVDTRPHGVRPTAVVEALPGAWSARAVLRTKQWIERGGARLEPLEADTRPRMPEACAS